MFTSESRAVAPRAAQMKVLRAIAGIVMFIHTRCCQSQKVCRNGISTAKQQKRLIVVKRCCRHAPRQAFTRRRHITQRYGTRTERKPCPIEERKNPARGDVGGRCMAGTWREEMSLAETTWQCLCQHTARRNPPLPSTPPPGRMSRHRYYYT